MLALAQLRLHCGVALLRHALRLDSSGTPRLRLLQRLLELACRSLSGSTPRRLKLQLQLALSQRLISRSALCVCLRHLLLALPQSCLGCGTLRLRLLQLLPELCKRCFSGLKCTKCTGTSCNFTVSSEASVGMCKQCGIAACSCTLQQVYCG